jgi:site-specific recombinase XerD
MDALLNAPDRQTAQGRRGHALLLFLYNSGARAQEAAQLLIGDLDVAGGSVKIRGKGGKQRQCPLWPSTIEELKALIVNRSTTAHVFLNRCARPITRFGIHALVRRYVRQVQMPSLAAKRVSPHTMRHYVPFRIMSGTGWSFEEWARDSGPFHSWRVAFRAT